MLATTGGTILVRVPASSPLIGRQIAAASANGC